MRTMIRSLIRLTPSPSPRSHLVRCRRLVAPISSPPQCVDVNNTMDLLSSEMFSSVIFTRRMGFPRTLFPRTSTSMISGWTLAQP